jgi:hypothetical protein
MMVAMVIVRCGRRLGQLRATLDLNRCLGDVKSPPNTHISPCTRRCLLAGAGNGEDLAAMHDGGLVRVPRLW